MTTIDTQLAFFWGEGEIDCCICIRDGSKTVTGVWLFFGGSEIFHKKSWVRSEIFHKKYGVVADFV